MITTASTIVGRLLPCPVTMSDNNSHVAMALLELIQNIIQWHRFWNPANIFVIFKYGFMVIYHNNIAINIASNILCQTFRVQTYLQNTLVFCVWSHFSQELPHLDQLSINSSPKIKKHACLKQR